MKKIIALALSLCIIGGSAPAALEYAADCAVTANAAEIVDSGECGENVIYTLDSEGTLTISGTGGMTSAFNDCSNIKSVIIENGVTSICAGAFSYCNSLKSIIIPDSVTSIDDMAFSNCKILESVTIPDTVISIGNYAFSETKWLENKQAENPLVTVNGILIDGMTCSGDVVIPDSVTSIGGGAFQDCISLESITIPDSVTGIGSHAFNSCSNLTSITIPDSVTSIGYSAFNSCIRLGAITILNPNCDIYDSSDTICSGFDSEKGGFYFGDTIYGYADSTAQTYAEKYGYNFEVITANAAEIVDSGSCGENVTYTLDSEGTLTISGTGNMTNYTYDDSPFYKNADIKKVLIGDSVTNIGRWAFSNCKGITSITIPDSVTVIGDYAFTDCIGLESVSIGDSVKNICDGAFYCCENLESITIPDSVTSIGVDPFHRTKWLENKRAEDPLVIVNGILIDGTTCEGDVIIPDSVTSIGNNSFANSKIFKSITIPDSVTSISYGAFYGCAGLGPITILNPDCEIDDSVYTICSGHDLEKDIYYFTGIIYGYANSTAQAYAEKYGYKFLALAPDGRILGDVNGDSSLDSSDAAMILQHYAAYQSDGKGSFTAAQLEVADFNGDSNVDSSDAALILKTYAENQSK